MKDFDETVTESKARWGADADTILFWLVNIFLSLSGCWYWIVRAMDWIKTVVE